MKKGYIMIFLTIWVIVITMIIFWGTSKIFSNLGEKNVGLLSEEGNAEENFQVIKTSSIEQENETIYLIKEDNGYISIYVIDKNGKEYLRERTQIVTKYLPEADKIKLKEGIRANGKNELNKVIEDYE